LGFIRENRIEGIMKKALINYIKHPKRRRNMKKFLKIERIVDTCGTCIYMEYDAYYDFVRDSGYFCRKEERRIISDWDWDNTNNPRRLNLSYTDIPIPDWCPLPDVED
jgi:hypothetical protein